MRLEYYRGAMSEGGPAGAGDAVSAPRRVVAIMIDGQMPDAETRVSILSHCPVVRLGKGRHMERREDGQVYVVPPEHCIGCFICERRHPDKVTMTEW